MKRACLDAMRALETALADELQPVPKGWFTRADYEEASGLKDSQARRKIREGIARGVIESKLWRFKIGPRPIYRVRK